MPPRTPRTFTAGRLVALVLIGLAVLGLAYLHFSRDSAAVSVPAGAQAGDLRLEPCHYGTEKGSYAADCGTLVVPENRHRADSHLIALPVTRIRALSPHPGAPVFRLEGGPGKTNMRFANASRFADTHDVVLVGYRGVDGSVRLDCPEVESALAHSTALLAQKSFDAYANGFRACASRLQADGVDLGGYSIPEQVDDLEAARRALGYGRVDLVSESAGTRTAMIYAWRYPKSIHRSVMIGVNPPGNFLWHPKTIDEQLRRYAALCAQDRSCSRRTNDLVTTLRKTSADMPGRFWFLPIDKGAVRAASFYGLMESTSEAAPLSGPMTLDSWLAAADGDASGFWLQALMGKLAFPQSFVWGELAAMSRIDADAGRRYFSSPERRADSILGNPGTEFIWGGGRLATAWPAGPDDDAYSRVRTSRVPTLLIGGELDGTTPPQIATRELLPHLPNGRQVVLPSLGHTIDFWSYQPAAGSHLVDTYLASGKVDDSLYTEARVDFTPEVTQTALGKGIAATMVGLALLTVLSLLWLPFRVHGNGRIGRKASALVRSVYLIVLGLGGWFLGVLIVLTAMPGTPLDDELLAAPSVGLPIGLAVYFAWTNRDWSVETKATGLAAAVGGALVGSWLGFHAADGLLALVTSIVGAAAGANLTLVLLDVAWDRRARDRFAGAEEREALPLHARPSVG